MINFYACYNKPGLDNEDTIDRIIKKDMSQAYYYALDIIKGRWIEAEPALMKEPYYAYIYAKYIIKGRWPEAEPYIKTDQYFAYQYARTILKKRWLEVEPYIMTCEMSRDWYCEHFKI